MKLHWTVLFVCLLVIVHTGHAQVSTLPSPSSAPDLTTMKGKASYAIGNDIGKGLRSQGIDVDVNSLLRGLTDALTGRQPLLNEQQAEAAMAEFQRDMAARVSARNKQQGAAYLAANKQKPGVATLPSGLQYQVVKRGTGPSPVATDKVKTHYVGTLIDGAEFDSSIRRGQPAEFQVNQVIPGWTEALMRMKVGGKWRLVIPSELAYGERGAGPAIGPNSVLVFEVELLGIVK